VSDGDRKARDHPFSAEDPPDAKAVRRQTAREEAATLAHDAADIVEARRVREDMARFAAISLAKRRAWTWTEPTWSSDQRE